MPALPLAKSTVQDPVHVCHRCDLRQKPCNGICLCTVDGRNITDHAKNWECPQGKFPARPAGEPSCTSRGLGDTIAKITKATGIAAAVSAVIGGNDCGCGKRQETLNRLFPYTKAK